MSVKKQFGSFDELLESSELPVLVDFYAPWCGPCQLMTGILDKVSEKMKDKVQIVKINTDNYPDLARSTKFMLCQHWFYLKMERLLIALRA